MRLAPESRWASPRFASFLIRRWDDAAFVFDPASGRTHYLNSGAAEILQQLAAFPCGVTELEARLLEEETRPDGDAFREATRRVVDLLDQLGLIARVPER